MSDIENALKAMLGADRVFSSQEDREFHSTDFSEKYLETALVVVRPSSTQDVVSIVQFARDRGLYISARGGGMSYTLGYAPEQPKTILLDMSAMNRVLEVNEEDLFIVVETGVTWAQIREALKDSRYHIPYGGTMSGIQATVGGGLGNNATGLGRGDITDDLLGVENVLPNGRIVRTGAVATGNIPLIRNYGPDFTGLFVNDGGAFGVRTKAWFRLHRRPGASSYASFGFNDQDRLVQTLLAIAREGVATEALSFRRYHHEQFASEPKPSMAEVRSLIRETFAMSSSRLRGIGDLLRAFHLSGVGFLTRWESSLHIITDGFNQSSADGKMRIVRQIAREGGGKALPSTMPLSLRAQPFNPIDRLIVGKDGECSFPSNCSVPFSRGPELVRRVTAFFESNKEIMSKHGLRHTFLFLSVKGLFGCEPIIYWQDRMNPLRKSVLRASRQETIGKRPPDTAARAKALDLRQRLVTEVFTEMRGAHFQIGKYYPYHAALEREDNAFLLDQFKADIDPGYIMNPGVLGLRATKN